MEKELIQLCKSLIKCLDKIKDGKTVPFNITDYELMLSIVIAKYKK